MLNLLESTPKPLVFGGNVNSTLKKWLLQLGITDFVHASIVAKSIGKDEIQRSADHIRQTYGHVQIIFSVGLFADKILYNAGLVHGRLPATSNKNQKEISAYLIGCRHYLLRRYNAPTNGPSGCS